MPRLPDLVRDTQLPTEFRDGLVIHSYHVSDTTQYRRSRIEQVRWQRGRTIGAGGQGSVHVERRSGRARWDQPKVRAVKSIRGGTHLQYLHELEAIAKFSHPRVRRMTCFRSGRLTRTQYEHCFVKSYGWYEDSDALYISMEYLSLGDLEQMITTASSLTEKDAATITAQILEGIEFMHKNDFAHRDIKPKVSHDFMS